ncbi:chymotrypsin-like protease CTRL-1 [Cherax quadricarinatus]|uniref:chymotrypsin-like protease CTRL-1 n=1 Tax=Cherax quadricarinatus TaxID=27406 RepID=UPI00387E4A4A
MQALREWASNADITIITSDEGVVVVAPCGSSVVLSAGVRYVVSSPGYPHPYSPFTYCRWFFKSESSSDRVSITCQHFELETSSRCSEAAFLALQDSQHNLHWYCGNVGPVNLVSTSDSITVHFWSSWKVNNTKRGFHCMVANSLVLQPRIICRCGREGHSIRVVGGSDAGLHQFPWQALVRLSSGFCGGILINQRFVLTAAHCVDSMVLPNGALPEVVLGEHDRSRGDETPYTQVVPAVRVIPHDKYGHSTSPKDHDIGLIELATEVDLEVTRNIAPACPPDQDLNYDNLTVTVSGWGYTSFPGHKAEVLQKVEMQTVPQEVCRRQYEAGVITDNMICAAALNKDSCFDDSGGPLMTKVGQHWQVVGIVSFGPSTCGNPKVSGVYTKIINYLPWIISKIGDAKTCPPET